MRSLSAFFALLLAGCTAVRVQPVDPSANLKHVCIEDNPKVTVPNFLQVVRDGFTRHGISTEVYSGEAPAACTAILRYTALRSWDVTTYLSHAELSLETRTGDRIASAEYHLNAKGGFSLMKWQSVKTKMDPVIDELLSSSR